MALSSSTTLLIEVEKDSNSSAASVVIDVKLTAGDFAVNWAVVNTTEARSGGKVDWMDHTHGQGRIAPRMPLDSVSFTISARNLTDYSVDGDLKTMVRFQSEPSERLVTSSRFEGQAAEVPLFLRVKSRAYPTQQGIRLFSTSEGTFQVTLVEHTMSFGAQVEEGNHPSAEVPWGNKVFIKLNVTDIDGLPIKRQIDLFAGVTDGTKEKFLIQEGTNEFSVACPEVWWSFGATGYNILIGADLAHPDLIFEIQFTQSSLVKIVAGGVILAGILALALFLVRVTAKANDRDEVKRLLLSFLQFELLLGNPRLCFFCRFGGGHSLVLGFSAAFEVALELW
jgi:hypothetical protein